MNNLSKPIAFAILCLCFLSNSTAQTAQINFINPSGACPTGTQACAVTNNSVRYSVTPPPSNPVNPNVDVIPRYKAFWIMGDGNYLEFPNTETDQESRSPRNPYNYSKTGTYNMSVYLTGKYTNHNPPPGATRQIQVGAPSPTPPAGAFAPTSFQQRPSTSNIDFFPVHDIRKNYEIPFVLSYPASMDSSWGYLFFNGRQRGGGAWMERPLQYQTTHVPNYYRGVAANIAASPASNLAVPGSIGAINFSTEFSNFSTRYADVLFFPLETAATADLPAGFSKKRYFPVFWAKNDSSIILGENDSLMSFCYVVTGPRPLPQADWARINQVLNNMDLKLSASVPINTSGPMLLRESGSSKMQQGPNNTLQFIQGVYTNDVKYVAAHDPNQLTVTNIDTISGNRYRVSFHLEMCNKGGGDTHAQTIDLFDRFARFADFTYNGNAVVESSTQPHHFIMGANLFIAGIPAGEYKMMCESIDFTATTDCDGVRSLWETNPERAFEFCVRFNETFFTECGTNLPIDTCEFKMDNGDCPCAVILPTCGGEGSILIFILIFVFILLIWKYYSDKTNNL